MYSVTPKQHLRLHNIEAELKKRIAYKKSEYCSGLSMNILHAGDKSPIQRGFFTNSTGNLLPTLGFLGGLYNFCNFVIIFSLMQVTMICRSSDIFYRFGNLPKKVRMK